MKKKLSVLGLALASLMVCSLALAQLVGTQRFKDHHWYAGDRAVKFGNTPNAEIKYDGTNLKIDVTSGGGKVSMPDGIIGNIDTASALAANPTDCSANQFATIIAANGNLTCAALTDAAVPNTITIDLASAATSLASDPSDCGPTQFATSINAQADLSCAALADADVPDTLTLDLAVITQADLTAGSCTLNQVRIDTGGATTELCFCGATNAWYCASFTTLTGPTD